MQKRAGGAEAADGPERKLAAATDVSFLELYSKKASASVINVTNAPLEEAKNASEEIDRNDAAVKAQDEKQNSREEIMMKHASKYEVMLNSCLI